MGDFGEVLRGARKARGKTQAELAARLKQDQSQLSRWETGELVPQPHELRTVAKVYGVAMDVLLPLYLPAAEQAAKRAA
jgi:transcriptional regulator with XRE-family HTH domain